MCAASGIRKIPQTLYLGKVGSAFRYGLQAGPSNLICRNEAQHDNYVILQALGRPGGDGTAVGCHHGYFGVDQADGSPPGRV